MIENIFSRQANEKQAKSIEECVKMDSVSEELWNWSANCEHLGKILFFGLIIWGIISSVVASIIFDEYGDFEKWNVMIFVTNIIRYGLYAYLEYLIYHTVALLLASWASITQNTRITARIAEYKARKAENNFSEEKNNVQKEKNNVQNIEKIQIKKSESSWICPKCGHLNEGKKPACVSCGKTRGTF